MFWSRPGEGPIRIANTGRTIAFLGQDVVPANRLLDLPTDLILSRIDLAFLADESGRINPAILDEVWRRGPFGRMFNFWFQADHVTYYPASLERDRNEINKLSEVANSATPEEISDASLIDGFFKPRAVGFPFQPLETEMELFRNAACGFGRGRWGVDPPKWQDGRFPLGLVSQNQFLCGEPTTLPEPITMYFYLSKIPQYFGVDPSQAWGKIRRTVQNAITVLRALENYPFPSPIPVNPSIWYYEVQSDLQKFIAQDIVINDALARMWITFETIDKYNVVADRITDALERRARRQRRKKILSNIALAATLIVITAGLAAAIAPLIPVGAAVTSTQVAQAVTGAFQFAISNEERKRAVEDLERVARQFEESDAGFAQEIRQAEEIMDFQAAENARQAQLTLEESQAIEEGRVEREYSPDEVGQNLNFDPEPGTSLTAVAVGGGVAAAALALFTLLK